MPTHAMQITTFPKHTLKHMQTKAMKFLWNDQGNKTRLRLVNWRTVTKPYANGGLNIPCLVKRNLALSASLAWRCLITTI